MEMEMTSWMEMVTEMSKILSPEVNLLLSLILFDVLTGIVKSAVKKKLSSSVGIAGLLKHTLVMVTMVTISLFAPIYGVVEYATLLISFYCLQYGLSILENWVAIGLPVPEFLYKMLDKMGKKFEDIDDKI